MPIMHDPTQDELAELDQDGNLGRQIKEMIVKGGSK